MEKKTIFDTDIVKSQSKGGDDNAGSESDYAMKPLLLFLAVSIPLMAVTFGCAVLWYWRERRRRRRAMEREMREATYASEKDLEAGLI